MRYPEGKIKEAILHPDIDIRVRATRYFAKSFSPDLDVMPLVIRAVETYGRDNETYRLVGTARDLAQSEDTIAWVIDELNPRDLRRLRALCLQSLDAAGGG